MSTRGLYVSPITHSPVKSLPPPHTSPDEKAVKHEKAIILIVSLLGWSLALYGFGRYMGYYIALERAPVTGRWHIVTKGFTDEYQKEVINRINQSIANGGRGKSLPVDHPVVQRALSVCDHILRANGLGRVVAGDSATLEEERRPNEAHRTWRLFVLHDETDDYYGTAAACGEDGSTLLLYTSALPSHQTDDRLAATLAHEVAHGILQHGAERRAWNRVYSFSCALFIAFGTLFSPPMALSWLWILPLRQRLESEADQVGAYLAAQAGYDPKAGIEGLQSEHDVQEVATFNGLMSRFVPLITPLYPSHPPTPVRVEALQKAIEKMRRPGPPAHSLATADTARWPSLAPAVSGREDLRKVSLEEWETHIKLYGMIDHIHLFALGRILGRDIHDVFSVRSLYQKTKRAFDTVSPAQDYDPAFIVALLMGTGVLNHHDHDVLRKGFQLELQDTLGETPGHADDRDRQ